jgi:RimJ/RimL family protein N-acetyltransferase
MLPLAHNQRDIAEKIEKVGAGVALAESLGESWHTYLITQSFTLSDNAVRTAMSATAAQICDGDGTARLVAEMTETKVVIRPAYLRDARRIWEWRKDANDIRFFRTNNQPSFIDHFYWYRAALTDPNRLFFIAEKGDYSFGYVRFDVRQGNAGIVSICLAAEVRGQNLASAVLCRSEELARSHGIHQLEAEIHTENVASLHCFESVGYIAARQSGEFVVYSRQLGETT